MGKAIYKPKGKAGEYARYACNFYVGCSNDCDYCYCKRGLLGHAMGAPTPTLKKCFKGHITYGVFVRELHENIVQLRQHGIFFSFTTDPLLPETQDLANAAVLYAVNQGVPCKILTKRADFKVLESFYSFQHLIAYGFTLTGSFLVWSDDNHPALLRGDLQHKAKQLAETFWNGKDTTCRIMTLSGCITYTHSEE